MTHTLTLAATFEALSSAARTPGAEGLRQVISACGAPATVLPHAQLTTGTVHVHRFKDVVLNPRRLAWYEMEQDLEYQDWAWGSRLCAWCREPGEYRWFPGVAASPRTVVPLCDACRWRLATQPKVIIVGYCNPETGDLPFKGPAGDRLRALLGLTDEQFYTQSRVVNVLPSPGAIRPSMIPKQVFHRLHGFDIEPLLERGGLPVLAFGLDVLSALGDLRPDGQHESFDVYTRWGQRVYGIPSTGGRCRFWNEPDNCAALRRLAEEIYSAPTWGGA